MATLLKTSTFELIQPNQTIIIGLSGGPDSTFLLHALNNLKAPLQLTLIAAHLDHQWRANSADDVIFCREQAEQLGIEFVSAQAHNTSKPTEEIGRKLRRAFFEQLAQQYHADAIALAHHADDQVETFFIRLMRGATLSGLVGMRQNSEQLNQQKLSHIKQELVGVSTDRLTFKLKGGEIPTTPATTSYIRPLLNMHKQEILDYLHTHNIPYLTDPTNNSDLFLRNRIRNHVIPALEQTDTRFQANFARTLEQLQAAEQLLTDYTAQTLKEISVNHHELDRAKFLALNSYLAKRVLLRWLINHRMPFTPSDGLLEEMMRFIKHEHHTGKKKHPLHKQWVLEKNQNKISINYC